MPHVSLKLEQVVWSEALRQKLMVYSSGRWAPSCAFFALAVRGAIFARTRALNASVFQPFRRLQRAAGTRDLFQGSNEGPRERVRLAPGSDEAVVTEALPRPALPCSDD